MAVKTSKGSSTDWRPIDKQFATLAVHAGYGGENKNLSALVPPITISATYEVDPPFEDRGFVYARYGNPSRKILEQKMAALDGGKHGFCFSSGMGAYAAMTSLLKSGDNVICSEDLYGGSYQQLVDLVKNAGIKVDFIDMHDMGNFKKALKPETKLVFVETPANPTMRVFDLENIAKIAHEFNKDILCAIDNSCLTAYFQRPLSLGFDIVHYSLSKFANGHADVVMGALVTNKDELAKHFNKQQYIYGAVPSPFDCYLVTRGLKTLPLRMSEAMRSSTKVAEYLLKHPKVESVNHPALPSHPDHALAKKQSSGHSGLMSFILKKHQGSSVEFLKNLKLIQSAGSFGGCESAAELPASFTHANVPEETRRRLGITENFIRLAIGLESTEDLIDDLAQALNAC